MIDRGYSRSPFRTFEKAVPTGTAQPLTADEDLVLGTGFVVRAVDGNSAPVYLVEKGGAVGDGEQLDAGDRASIGMQRPGLVYCISAVPGQVLKFWGA